MTTVEKIQRSRKRRREEMLLRKREQRAVVAILLIVVCLVLLAPPDYDDFLDALAHRESTGDHEVVNRYGYMGLYQMGTMALRDAGFLDDYENWTDTANAYDVYSKDDFLSSPRAQKAAVTAYHMKLCTYIESYGLEEYIGTEYQGVRVSKSGLLAACHLVGVKSMRRALETGETVCDGNNTPASEYLELFSGYNISRVWK